ncbi:hypothetical protein Tco_1185825 [Tanacetum coccineum]
MHPMFHVSFVVISTNVVRVGGVVVKKNNTWKDKAMIMVYGDRCVEEGSDEGGWKVVDMMVCGGGPLGVREMRMKGYEVVEVTAKAEKDPSCVLLGPEVD